jgi:hypothetical protein
MLDVRCFPTPRRAGGRRSATVPNGTFNRVIVTLWHSFSASLKKGKVEIHPLFAMFSYHFPNCGTVIALEHGVENQFLIFYGKSIRH